MITAEVSGIAPALATAQALGVPLIFARKHRSSIVTEDYYTPPRQAEPREISSA